MARKAHNSCRRQEIEFDTQRGLVSFRGRPGGSRACPTIERPEPTASQECSNEVFARAVEFCKATSRSALQQRLCVGPAVRRVAHLARCTEKR